MTPQLEPQVAGRQLLHAVVEVSSLVPASRRRNGQLGVHGIPTRDVATLLYVSQVDLAGSRRVRVFCSYAHEDFRLMKMFHTALGSLREIGLIESWTDDAIRAGTNWEERLLAELEKADIIVFLVSSDSCDSPYVIRKELRRALDRELEGRAVVIPFVVRDVDYPGTPFENLEPLVKVNKELRPLKDARSRDSVLKVVVREIRKLAETWKFPPPVLGETSTFRPPIHGWPPERRALVVGRRRDIETVATELRSQDNGGVVALVGVGGLGKTTIALEYARQRAGDYTTIAWIRAEDSPTLAFDFGEMATHVGFARSDQESAQDTFREWLKQNPGWLIVFDNATDLAAVRNCLPNPVRGHVIITSRERGWSPIAKELSVDRLTVADSVTMLLELTGDQDGVAAEELVQLLDRLPMALQDAAAAVRQEGWTMRSYVDDMNARLRSEGTS